MNQVVNIYLLHHENTKDANIAKMLVKYLRLCKNVKLTPNILASDYIATAKERYLKQANIIMLGISIDMLSLQTEIQLAMQQVNNKKAILLPLLFSTCPYEFNENLVNIQLLPNLDDAIDGLNSNQQGVFFTNFAKTVNQLANQIRAKRLDSIPTTLFTEQPDDLIGEQAHLFCNREEQVDEYLFCIEDKIKPPRKRGFSYLVHGKRPEEHSALNRRFSEELVDEFIDLKEDAIAPRINVNFPQVRPNKLPLAKKRLMRELRKAFSLKQSIMSANSASITATEIAQKFNKYTIVPIEHNIYAKEWTSGTMQLITEYLNGFWNEDLADNHPQFIIYFNIKYSSKVDAQKVQAIIKDLTQFATTNPDKISMLEELDAICENDVDEWYSQYETKIKFKTSRSALINQLFAKQQYQPMEVVIPALKKVVSEALSL